MADYLLRAEYEQVKRTCSYDIKGDDAGTAIIELVLVSLHYLLEQCSSIPLVSKVTGKEYFTFGNEMILARPANSQLFLLDPDKLSALWNQWLLGQITGDDFAQLSYTSALAPCLAMELFDRQNKKGPATYFECYIGHLFAKAFNVNPIRQARLPVRDRKVAMTMDFLFDVDATYPKIHVPVKMSTRERVVQAWAHQRLLDSAYGDDAYRGIMVLFSETKLDSRKLEVVEICVPDQWLAYQLLLARMDRIYYLDAPERYKTLANAYPDLFAVKPLKEFLFEHERNAILARK